jgi:hypothetical protein
LAQGGIAMNSSFLINIYHGTFLENLSYWVLLSICQNLLDWLESDDIGILSGLLHVEFQKFVSVL